MHPELLMQVVILVVKAFVRLLYSPLFWVVVLILSYQYYRMHKSREVLFGIKGEPIRQYLIVLSSGLAGGLLGSFLMIFVGISLNNMGIIWLWPAAVVLMLFNPRFLCFSYAAGLISLSYLLFGIPDVDIPQLMALVALLHMVEAMMILITGHLEAAPVYTRNKYGRVIGAFNLQKFWPIPFVALAAAALPEGQLINDFVGMPGWWPLIKPGGIEESASVVYQILPVVAALGYGDVAATSRPRDKSRCTAISLFVFSLALLGLAILASHVPQTTIFAVFFSPLGHEVVIWLGQKDELVGTPFYVDPERGVMVLDVMPGSPAANLGLGTGDIIINVNDQPVNSKYNLAAALETSLGLVEAEWQQCPSNRIMRSSIRKCLGQSFGVILAPGPYDSPTAEFGSSGLLGNWLRKFSKRVFHH